MNRESLLNLLPPRDGEVLSIVKEQSVDDIVKEILDAHAEFAPDYDLICEEFAAGDTLRRLYDFCKQNLRNDTETVKLQTTRSPTALLEMGHCDCKGYAGFIGGILDALNRSGDGKYNWCYRFAEYDDGAKLHNHVFIVVKDPGGKETWIDPVLDSFNSRSPFPDKYFDRKKSTMTPMRISGMRPELIAGGAIGCGCQALQGFYGAIGDASSYYDLTGGQVFAVDQSVRPNGMTADQMGLPYAMQLLARGYEQRHPGTAAAWWANPPVTFWLNGQPYPLPPPVTNTGGDVPLLPMGLTVKYAPSFAGLSIPATFLKPIVVAGPGSGYQNKLRLNSTVLPGLPTNQFFDTTSAYLSSSDSLPLILLEAAVGPLINSFSAYPYASNFDSTNNIDDKMFNHRNADDLLQPSISHTVLQSVAPIAEIALQGLNFIAPGLGVLAAGAVKAAAGTSQKNVGPGVVVPGSATDAGILPSGSAAGGIMTWIQNNPLLAAAIAALVGITIYELTD